MLRVTRKLIIQVFCAVSNSNSCWLSPVCLYRSSKKVRKKEIHFQKSDDQYLKINQLYRRFDLVVYSDFANQCCILFFCYIRATYDVEYNLREWAMLWNVEEVTGPLVGNWSCVFVTRNCARVHDLTWSGSSSGYRTALNEMRSYSAFSIFRIVSGSRSSLTVNTFKIIWRRRMALQVLIPS